MLLKSNKIISFLFKMVLCTHYLINDFIFVVYSNYYLYLCT